MIESAYTRVVRAMGAVTISREEGDKILEYVKGAIHDSYKPCAPKKRYR